MDFSASQKRAAQILFTLRSLRLCGKFFFRLCGEYFFIVNQLKVIGKSNINNNGYSVMLCVIQIP